MITNTTETTVGDDEHPDEACVSEDGAVTTDIGVRLSHDYASDAPMSADEVPASDERANPDTAEASRRPVPPKRLAAIAAAAIIMALGALVGM